MIYLKRGTPLHSKEEVELPKTFQVLIALIYIFTDIYNRKILYASSVVAMSFNQVNILSSGL